MNARLVSRFGSPLILSFAGAILALALFGLLAEEVFEGDARHFDEVVRQTIHAQASPALTTVMRAFTFLGSVAFVLVASVCAFGALWLTGHRRRAVLIVITVVGGLLLMSTLKVVFHRARPDPFFDTALPASYSFPSGHALVSCCFYGAAAALALRDQKKTWIRATVWTAANIVIFMIGLSRIYLGVHYPSDVIAGYIAATAWVLGVAVVSRRLSTSGWPRRGQRLGGAH
jgi:undecaprenyl-diphosphatase